MRKYFLQAIGKVLNFNEIKNILLPSFIIQLANTNALGKIICHPGDL